MRFSKLVKVMVVVMTIAIAFSFVGNNVQAAKKKSVTLFKGEVVSTGYVFGTLKSVKSSKKSVVSVKKENGKPVMTAKKTGKATVTIKTSRGKQVYSVTVKGNPFKITTYANKDKGVVIQGVNSSSKAFSWVTVVATFCDAAGNPITESKGTLWHIGPKQKGYANINVYNSGIDFSKTKYSVTSDNWSRGYESKYKGYGKNVSMSVKEDSDKIKFKASTKYKGNGSIHAACDIVFKDAAGNVVSTDTQFLYLYKNKKTDTSTGLSMPSGATKYEILNKRAYLTY